MNEITFFLIVSDLRYQLIAEKIRELNTVENTKQQEHTADIVLTNFQFATNEMSTRKSGATEFFVLAISYDTQLFVTKAATPHDGKLMFTEKFCLKNVDEKLCAKVEVYSMKLKTERSFVDSLLRKVCKIYLYNIRSLKQILVFSKSIIPHQNIVSITLPFR